MLEAYLTPEVFRDGMRIYMRRHGDGNARARDLWDALAEASGQPVREVAEDWITRPGFPLVEASLNGGRLRLSQSRLNLHGQMSERPWAIPMVLRFVDVKGERIQRLLFDSHKTEIELGDSAPIICANADASGFYRCSYDETLSKVLNKDFHGLAPVERAAYLSDLWAVALAGRGSFSALLDAIAGLGDEREEAVLGEAATKLAYLSGRLLGESERAGLRRFVEHLFLPAFERMGWEVASDEDESSRMRRAELLRLAGNVARSDAVMAEAGRRLDAELATGNGLDPNLVDTATVLGARIGGPDRFAALIRAAGEAPDPMGRRRYRTALGAVEDPDIQRRSLGLTLTDTIPGPDLFRFFNLALGGPTTRDAGWRFLRENWPALAQRTGGQAMLGYLVEFVQSIGADYADDVTDFFTSTRVPRVARTVEQTLEVLAVDKAAAGRARSEVGAWLAARD